VSFHHSNRVLDTSTQDKEGQPVTLNKPHRGVNQRWNVIYLDKAAKRETKGLNEEFGFYINRPFYIVSELPFNRVCEMHGNTAVTLRRWRNNQRQQQWWFDEVRKVVRNNYWKNYALDIQSNGRSNNLRTAGINSRWW
jgi:hypothetical protein